MKNTPACALISEAYKKTLASKVKLKPQWGATGFRQAARVEALVKRVNGIHLLDYGCGNGSLGVALRQRGNLQNIQLWEYDPGRDIVPVQGSADVVTCIDVMEHVEEDKVKAVLKDIGNRTGKAAYFLISTTKAIHTLPDGRNAHITVHPYEWWNKRLSAVFACVDAVMVKGSWFIVECCHDCKFAL